MVLCEVIDNGVGRQNSSTFKTHTSKGTKLTEERISYLSFRYKCKAKIEIIDLFENEGKPSGTHVKMWLPIIPT